MIRPICILLVLILGLLQTKLWIGNGNIVALIRLYVKFNNEQKEIINLQNRNNNLISQITFLKANDNAIEEYARYNLGMVGQNETYYQVVIPVK